MAKLTLTLSANAGLAVSFGDARIWVDALHESCAPGFSTIDRQLQVEMCACSAFFNPDAILFTHCHGDHFSREMTIAAMQIWPRAQVYLPERHIEGQHLVTGEEERFSVGNVQVRFLRLIHEGEQYADVPHYSILLSCKGKNLLISGDCRRCDPALAEKLAGLPIHVAVLDFPWLTRKDGRQYVQQRLRPTCCVGYHLPFAKDDSNGFRESAQRAAREMGAYLLMEPLQELQLDI